MHRVSEIFELIGSITDDELVIYTVEQSLKQLREEFQQDGPKYGARVCQLELQCLSIESGKGFFAPRQIVADRKGRNVKFPDIENFPRHFGAYATRRLCTVTSPLMRIRYALLAARVTHHNRLVDDAISEIVSYANKSLERGGVTRNDLHYPIPELLSNAFDMAIAHKRPNAEEIKALIWKYVESVDLTLEGGVHDKFELLELLVKRKGQLTTLETEKLSVEIESLANHTQKGGITPWFESMVELNIAFHAGNAQAEKLWRVRKGEYYETLATNHGNAVTAAHYLLKAMEQFQIAGEKVRLKSALIAYEGLADKLQFENMKTSAGDMSGLIEAIREEIAGAKCLTGAEILHIITSSDRILPTKKYIVEQQSNSAALTPLTTIIGRMFFDESRNIARQTEAGTVENQNVQLLETYSMMMGLGYTSLIHGIIGDAIADGRLSLRVFLEHIDRFSWYAQPLSISNLPPQIRSLDLRSQIVTIVAEYFGLIEMAMTNSRFVPSFQLCIDSLSLKIESLLRGFAKLNAIPTKKCKRRNGQMVLEEMNLDDLLRSIELSATLGEDIVLFLQWLLVEQGSMRLRHRVAHGTLSFREYSIEKVHLLFVALLRLSAWGVRVEE